MADFLFGLVFLLVVIEAVYGVTFEALCWLAP